MLKAGLLMPRSFQYAERVPQMSLLEIAVTPDYEALVDCIKRVRTPERVHHIELYLDPEVQQSLCDRFDLGKDLNPYDPYYYEKRQIALQSFLGYDYVRCSVDGLEMPLVRETAADTALLTRGGGRTFVNEHRGLITTWEEFEAYPWPDPHKVSTRALEWYERNLPDNMCVIGSGSFAHFAEFINWLMGYETLCIALFENRELVQAIADRLLDIYEIVLEQMLQFERIKIIWGSDDMGFRSSTLISPADLRAFVFPGHRKMAQMSHAAGRPYLLHACGNLSLIMEDLIEDVGIDAKHSFEDTIELVQDTKRLYGDRIALLGGIDVDFLCRSDELAIRQRVRETLEVCQPDGGYCLGTGNSVANYIPVENYLIMLDEGRRYGK
jgi:uroporphyrinogen decarboxylase